MKALSRMGGGRRAGSGVPCVRQSLQPWDLAALAVLLLGLSPAACGDRSGATSPGRPVPGAIATLAGDHQRGTVSQQLPSSLVVEVTDPIGQPLGGVPVAWGALVGGGFTSADTGLTDDSGRAAVAWTVGTVAELNSAIARVEGLPADTFVAAALPGPAARIRLVAQQSTSFVGSPIFPMIQATLLDALRNLATGAVDSVRIAITPGTGAQGALLSGTVATVAAGGRVNFADLQIDRPGTGFTFTLSSPCCASVTTHAFDMLPDPITQVGFLVMPYPVWPAGAVVPHVLASFQNADGNTMTFAVGNLTLSLTPGTGTPGAVLSGPLTQIVVNGMATFDYLSVDRPGTGYTLTLTSPSRGLSAVSPPFDVR